jgi:hypothetical protein
MKKTGWTEEELHPLTRDPTLTHQAPLSGLVGAVPVQSQPLKSNGEKGLYAYMAAVSL